ncbi:hypothetical protein [Priestia megaterium]|uniref:hypothetical protein n=2 Tax=Bacillaceae TaxID=186817 RepID=UPI003D05E5CC
MEEAVFMKRLLWMGFIVLFSLNMLVEPITARAEAQEQRVSQSQVTFENKFRRLWMDHVLWTSNYITSATTAGAEDKKQVLARLFKNQEDIGNTVKQFPEKFNT